MSPSTRTSSPKFAIGFVCGWWIDDEGQLSNCCCVGVVYSEGTSSDFRARQVKCRYYVVGQYPTRCDSTELNYFSTVKKSTDQEIPNYRIIFVVELLAITLGNARHVPTAPPIKI